MQVPTRINPRDPTPKRLFWIALVLVGLGVNVPAAIPAQSAVGHIAAGKPHSVCATVTGGSREGLAHVRLAVGEHATTRWVWLRQHETKQVVFQRLAAPAVGERRMRYGELTRKLSVRP